MYQRKDGLWVDTLPRKGKAPKFFYGKTKAEVKAKMSAWQEQTAGTTIASAIKLWEDSKTDVTAGTMKTYRQPIQNILDAFADTPTDKLTPSQIQAFINRIADKGFSKSYVEKHLSVLSMVYNHLITMPDSTLTYNPCTSVRLPASCVNVRRELPDRKCIEIIKTSLDVEFGLFPYLLIYTGLRRGEALALTDKDFKDGQIYITKTTTEDNPQHIKEPKSKAGVRVIPLLEPLKKALPKWQGYLFSNDNGATPLTSGQFDNKWRAYCLETGLCEYEHGEYHFKVCPHQLRHEFATICFDAGLDPMDTQELLGHSHEQTTRAIYTHIKESRRVKTTGKLNEYINHY